MACAMNEVPDLTISDIRTLLINEAVRTLLDVKPGAEIWRGRPRLERILNFDPLELVSSEGLVERRRVMVKGVPHHVLMTPVRHSNETLAGVIAVFRNISDDAERETGN